MKRQALDWTRWFNHIPEVARGRYMITCHLPLRTNIVRFSDIAGLIADAIHNNRELHEWQRCKYWANQELINLARNGSLKLRNPDTLGRLDIDPGTRDLEGVLSYTVMTLDDLKLLLADRHIEVSTGEEFQKLVEELGVWAAEVFQQTWRWLLVAQICLCSSEHVYQRPCRW